MRSILEWLSTDKWRSWLGAIAAIAVSVGVFLRLYRLNFPALKVFDEIYFPVFAQNYLTGTSFYDVHPPLGKFAIALGIWLFGNEPLGWRIIPAITGVVLIFFLAYLVWRMTKDKIAAILMLIFVAIDGMFVVYSRVGLMDGILVGSIFLALLVSVVGRQEHKLLWLWYGLSIGIAVAIKWPAVGIIFPIIIYAGRHQTIRALTKGLFTAAIVYFAIVVLGQVLIHEAHPFTQALNWHQQAFLYHAGLQATHPWGSAWWSWPILWHPVLLLYEGQPNGMVQIMTTIGNPIIWWWSTAAVAISTIMVAFRFKLAPRRVIFEDPLFPLLVGYYAMWLPWAMVHRVLFIYHYFPSYVFALAILAYWLGVWWKRRWYSTVAFFLGISLFFAVMYLPWSVGWIAVPGDYPSLLYSWFH